MNKGPKRVTFAKYNLKKWQPSVEVEYKKTLRNNKPHEVVDMRDKPIEEELEALQVAENMIVNEEVSLQAACDWLEYKTDRRISPPGLKKHIDKKYGIRSERLGIESTSLLAR